MSVLLSDYSSDCPNGNHHPSGDDMDLEFPPTHHPMLAPDVIHSEEHDPLAGRGGKPKIHPGSGPTVSSRPDRVTSSTTTTSTTTQQSPPGRTRRPQYPTTTTTPMPLPPHPHEPPFTDLPEDYYDAEDYKFPEPDFGDKSSVQENPVNNIPHSDSSNIALIISIIAGALIVIILIVLLVLKIKGRRDSNFKVDESKNYEGIPTMPTTMINGQGNGTIKPGDRRPVKKQKDIKEWYV